jgi:hypothetical protein
MEGFGKSDVALTRDALLFELERRMSDVEALYPKMDRQENPAETWKSYSAALKRVSALAHECVRRGFLKP